MADEATPADEPSEAVDPATWSCPTPVGHRSEVLMGHGGGGRLTAELVAEVFLPALGNDTLSALADAAVVEVGGSRLAMSTDAFVVRPLFFPGGDIGHLAVYGTVNDLACAGAVPLYLTASFVIDEGTSFDTLRRVAASMAEASRQAGVRIIAGDTKVVEGRVVEGRVVEGRVVEGRLVEESRDGVIITTAGVGLVRPQSTVAPDRARPGDAIIVSGPIGQHGVAVMSVREGLEFGSPVLSDTAPVHGLVEALFAAGLVPHVLRDPTRGGVAAALNEIAVASGVGVDLDESSIPVPPAVRSACALLGMDPLQVANEGRLVVLLPSAQAERAVEALRGCPGGEGAVIIGSAVPDHPGMVVARTALGATRVVDLPLGELLPRIC